MKEKSVFDRIYQKDLNLKFKNLTKVNVAKNVVAVDETSKEKVEIKEASDETLDAYINLFYNSKSSEEVKIPNTFEKEVLKEKVLRNREKAKRIRETLSDLETEIKDRVKDKAFALDISKSTSYKKASNDIFGGNKNRITFEDYLTLLELREQIIINESSDIMG